MTRRQIIMTVAVTAVVWLVLGSTWPLLPVRWFVTLVHEAGHASVAEFVGGDVESVTINRHGGGLTTWRIGGRASSFRLLLVSSAGYVGTAVVGGAMLELATRIRRGRVAIGILAAVIALAGLAWVPLRFRPSGAAAVASGSSTGDGVFTALFCVAAVLFLIGLAWQPIVRVRGIAILALATALCLASVDDLRRVFSISTRGGHSDAASAAAITPLPSWLWATIWLLLGVAACAVGLWAAVGRTPRSEPGPVEHEVP